MTLPSDQLSALWGPPLGDGEVPACLSRVSTDSRADLEGALFVALVGERFDGHRFLEAALSGGAAAAVAGRDRLSEGQLAGLMALGRPIWLVDDTLAAYQDLGRLWRRHLGVPVVAVTGSAGKTTTRELIRAVLAPLGPVVASSGNENNDIGAPLTLLRADGACAALVVEMGMRGLGEIERLSRCAEPDVAVITNIGTAHIGRLGSREAIATAKCEITGSLRPDGLLVIPAGDPLLEAALAPVWAGRVCRVALADDALAPGTPAPDLTGHLTLGGEDAAASGDWLVLPDRPPLALPLPGRHNARNLLLALAVAKELGVAPDALTELLVEVPGGRSRRLDLGGVRVLDETYNASPEAVLAALDLLARQSLPPGGRRWAVLGTMLELGEQSLELHAGVARRAAELGLDGVMIVDGGAEGEAMLAAAAGLGRLERVVEPLAAVAVLADWLQPGDALLLKASRGVALERLLPELERCLIP
jgi:UDP-N-acetylmuramoyl-tripeptide--D-alanyl-D-alanine ligase